MKLQGISTEGLQRIASVKPGMPKRGQMLPEDPSLFEDEDEEIEEDEEEEDKFESMKATELLEFLLDNMPLDELINNLHQAMGSSEAKANYLHIIQMYGF
jgi:hypothetical protein